MDKAIDIAMIKPMQVEINRMKNLKLNVEFKLFSIAIKNMLDNGLKYSPNKHVSVITTEQNIKIYKPWLAVRAKS